MRSPKPNLYLLNVILTVLLVLRRAAIRGVKWNYVENSYCAQKCKKRWKMNFAGGMFFTSLPMLQDGGNYLVLAV
jgi:hypothetical protein